MNTEHNTVETITPSYNGWTNRETWCANLWLSNEYDTYKYLQEIAAMCGDAGVLASRMAAYFLCAPKSWRNDVGELAKVNWLEIAQNWLEA